LGCAVLISAFRSSSVRTCLRGATGRSDLRAGHRAILAGRQPPVQHDIANALAVQRHHRIAHRAEHALYLVVLAFADGEPVYDIAFENVQAGLRTDYLFRLANQRSGFVIGTGDLSELALGWCTYGVGDQMSHYGVNAGVPKTLIQYLIRWTIASTQFDPETDAVLEAILNTEISPELVPADAAAENVDRFRAAIRAVSPPLVRLPDAA